jgi:hypothetical protein
MEKIAPAGSAGKSAWPMERKRFAAGRARCAEAVLLDPNLSGSEKRVIGTCLFKHMHAGEQWSCYASMTTLATEAEVCERVCWSAIQKAAAGKYILRHTARRGRGSKYKVTHIAIHPNYLHDHADSFGNSLQDLSKTPCKILPNNLLERTFKEEGRRGKEGEECKVFIELDSPQWRAWREYRKTQGRGIPQTDHRVCGILKRGWWLPAEWPPRVHLEAS